MAATMADDRYDHERDPGWDPGRDPDPGPDDAFRRGRDGTAVRTGPDGSDGLDDAVARALEEELCRLQEISAARVVADDVTGRVSELHVLARPGKHPKQVARDVQSVALASFGLELDRRVISVVQIGPGDDPDVDVAGGGFRPLISGITAEVSGLRSLVRVTLTRDDDTAVGFAEGSVASSARHRLVATAALDALRQLDGAAERVDVESAHVVRVGMHDVAVVTVVFVLPHGEQVMSGSALVRGHSEADAVARAVLDATNRRLTPLLG